MKWHKGQTEKLLEGSVLAPQQSLQPTPYRDAAEAGVGR